PGRDFAFEGPAVLAGLFLNNARAGGHLAVAADGRSRRRADRQYRSRANPRHWKSPSARGELPLPQSRIDRTAEAGILVRSPHSKLLLEAIISRLWRVGTPARPLQPP